MKPALTYGMTHLAIAVRDIERTRQFYCEVFDMEVMYHHDDFLQLTTRGCHDILVFQQKPSLAIPATGGIEHFGFRLRDPADIGIVRERILQEGGNIKDKGEFVPGSPYLYCGDPDGYTIEVWFELDPTSK